MDRRRPHECPYARPFAADFSPCPAFRTGEDAGRFTRRLRDLAELNLADVTAYVDANQGLLDQIGMPRNALLQLVAYQLEQFVNQPSSEPPGAPPAEVMAKFPLTVRRLIMPDEAGSAGAPTP